MPPVVETHKRAEQALKLVSIKIPESEMIQIRAAAALHGRSISGQAAHWIRLGQAFERDPMVGFSRVERALKAQLSLDQLSGAEREAYFDKFAEMMRNPSEQDKVAFEKAVNYPGAVGLDDNDNLIYASSKPGISEEERAKRKAAVDFARGSCRFEGIILDQDAEELNRRYIDGEITGEEHVALGLALANQKYGTGSVNG